MLGGLYTWHELREKVANLGADVDDEQLGRVWDEASAAAGAEGAPPGVGGSASLGGRGVYTNTCWVDENQNPDSGFHSSENGEREIDWKEMKSIGKSYLKFIVFPFSHFHKSDK